MLMKSSSDLLDGKTRVKTQFNIANIATSMFKKRRSDYFQSLSAWRSDKVTATKTLRQFLTKKSRVASFREFLKKEFSEENLDFWLEIESYRKQKSNKQLKLAQIIHETYVDVNAPSEINIDAGTRATTKSNMQKPDSATFDLAQVRVFLLMERDSFPRFLLSKFKPTVATKTPNGPKL
uniref:RGS domain-containing protein n=1 Tax=Ciona savignyi TaxID=51511 RepID=H2YTF7_CIOSA